MPVREPVRGGPVVERDQFDARLIRPVAHHGTEPAESGRARTGQAMLVGPEQGREHRQRHVLHHVAAKRAPGCVPMPGQAVEQRGQALADLRFGLADLDPLHQMMRVEREQHGVGAEGVQAGAGLDQLLGILGVIRGIGLDPNPPPEAADTQSGQEVVHRRGGEHGEAHGLGGQPGRGLRQDGGPLAVEAHRLQRRDPGIRERNERVPRAVGHQRAELLRPERISRQPMQFGTVHVKPLLRGGLYRQCPPGAKQPFRFPAFSGIVPPRRRAACVA